MNTQKRKEIPSRTINGIQFRAYEIPRKNRKTYLLCYYLNGTRKQETIKGLEATWQRAEKVSEDISKGHTIKAELTALEAERYLRTLEKLKPYNLSIEQAADYYIARHKGIVNKTVEDVCIELEKAKEKKSKSYRHSLQQTLKTFRTKFGSRIISTITKKELEDWLSSLDASPRYVNNHRTSVVTLFRFARGKDYLPREAQTEADRTERQEDFEGEIEIFTPEEMTTLLENASEDLIPCLALGAFAGLRSSEIQRLHWTDIKWEKSLIEVKAFRKTKEGREAIAKTRQRRLVPILPNLMAWLASYRQKEGNVCIYERLENATRRLIERINSRIEEENVKLSQKKDLMSWKQNGLRHSFISYRMELIKNENQVAYEAGNSPQKIYSNYRELVAPQAAKQWFDIVPERPRNVLAIGA